MNKSKFIFTSAAYKSLIDELQAEADPAYKEFAQRIIPGVENFFGVRTPAMRKITKRLLKDFNAASLLDCFSDQLLFTGTLEEKSVLGSAICAVSYDSVEEAINAIQRFLPQIDNWATCDSFVGKLKPFISTWRDEFWRQTLIYLKSDNPWEIRLGLVIIIAYYSQLEFIDEIFAAISPIQSDHYYVRMGMAWMLSMLYLVDKEKVLRLMQEKISDDWVFNKTIQKIKESRQIEKKEKEYLNKYKRK